MLSVAAACSMRGVPLVMTSRDDELAAFLAAHDPAVIRFVEERCASQQPVFAIYDPRHPKRVLLPETL